MGLNKFDNGSFRQIFKIKKFEWCSLMAGESKSNYMTNMIINTFKSSVTTEIFHKCPFLGKISLLNVTLKAEPMLSIYPTGVYRIVIKAYDDIDDNILTLKLSFDLKN